MEITDNGAEKGPFTSAQKAWLTESHTERYLPRLGAVSTSWRLGDALPMPESEVGWPKTHEWPKFKEAFGNDENFQVS